MKSINPDHIKLALYSSLKSSEIVLESSNPEKGAALEVTLFSSLYLLMTLKELDPTNYKEFETKYFLALISLIKNELGIEKQLPTDIVDFINNRFQMYAQQLNSIGKRGLPAKIAYNFFEQPLTLHSSDSNDFPRIVKMSAALKYVFEALNKTIYELTGLHAKPSKKYDEFTESKKNEEFKYDPNARVLIKFDNYELILNKTTKDEIIARYGSEFSLTIKNEKITVMKYAAKGLTFWYNPINGLITFTIEDIKY